MKYILMKAHTVSEWAGADFALVPLSPKRLAYFKEMRDLIEQVNKSHSVNQLVVYGDNADFLIDPQDIGFDIPEENAVIIDIEDADKFAEPAQQLRNGEMKFSTDDITFCTYGKHTDEEYWCRCSYEDIFK